MSGVVFKVETPVVAPDPNRADIACFVGFVGRRTTRIPAEMRRWLSEQGWIAGPYGRPSIDEVFGQAMPSYARSWLIEQGWTPRNVNRVSVESLLNLNIPALVRAWLYAHNWLPYGPVEDLFNLPVPIDNWEVFDNLFAWDQRPFNDRGRKGATYLGAAVRSFFAQGGRKCYVIRAGDTWPLTTDRYNDLPLDTRRCIRIQNVKKMIPGYQLSPERAKALSKAPADTIQNFSESVSAVERKSWRGIAHLFGLPDVSFVCLPDLADAFGIERADIDVKSEEPQIEEQFVERSAPEPAAIEDSLARLFRAPRCDDEGYTDWAAAVRAAAELIATHRREAQLIAAVPVPVAGTRAERDLLDVLIDKGYGPLANHPSIQLSGLASAFVQLAYPWARSPGSDELPEKLESPDAILAGILARNALASGTFRSAANSHLADVYDVFPVLPRYQIRNSRSDGAAGNAATLLERVSLFAPTPAGLRLLSDVTTSLSESYRPASINRLVSVIVRAARRLGEESVFEPSGERLWAQLRERLESLLSGLLAAGALRGETAADAFHVECGRSTMSQNDIDNGRVIVVLQFNAAFPIDNITVALSMDEGGQVSLLASEPSAQAALSERQAKARTRTAEAVAASPLPDLLNIDDDTKLLSVTINDLDQTITLPAGQKSRDEIVAAINREARGGYARLTDVEDAGEENRLVIGSDQPGVHSFVRVAANLALNFTKTTAAKGSAIN